MRRTTMLAAGLVAAVMLAGAPAGAVATGRPSIVDPAADANGLNDQGLAGISIQGQEIDFIGDNEGESFAPADLLDVWFTNDHRELRVNIHTTEPPTRSQLGLALRVDANEGCLRFEALIPGATFDGPAAASVRSVRSWRCGEGSEAVAGGLRVIGLPDTTGLTTLTFRLNSHQSVRSGSWLFEPSANTRLALGHRELGPLAAVQIDNTKPGLSFHIKFVPPPPPPKEPNIDKPATPDKAKKNKKGNGHDKHGCDHPGKGKGHDGDCPEDSQDDQKRAPSGKLWVR